MPSLERADGGSIVITSSVNGTRMARNLGRSAYASSKAGQEALAKILPLELASNGVRVNVICPGEIESQIDYSTDRRDVTNAALPAIFPEGKVPLTGGRAG